MISGASGAEAAFLIIDAREGVQEQSRRHAYMLSLLGIKSVYIVVNKMDLVDYSQTAYEKIRERMEEFLSPLGVRPIEYIPVSAIEGANILSRSEKLGWFAGKSLIESMDSMEGGAGSDAPPLRFPIQDVYKFDDRRIVAGRIEHGAISAGDEVTVYPAGRKTTVKTLEFWAPRDARDAFRAGESAGVTLTDEFFNRRGEIISAGGTPPRVARAFRANVFWMGARPLRRGNKYRVKIATDEVMGEISKILRVIDTSTLDASGADEEVARNDAAEVIIKTDRAVAFDAFSDCAPTGRFVILDGYDVAGGGIITGGESPEAEMAPTFSDCEASVRCDIFREFYFNLSDFTGTAQDGNEATYSVGDSVPLKGESYSYPENFDVICAKEYAVAMIRESRFSGITGLDRYEFRYVPLVDDRGFAIKASTGDEFALYLEDLAKLDAKTERGFSEKWLAHERYRRVLFHSGYWII
jgi:sulfate adenylyltransferase subunit 1 (EFTu-like GTPase family)